MKKVILGAFLICSFSTVNFPAFTLRAAFSRVGDRINRRVTDDQTKTLDQISTAITKLVRDFDTARNAEFNFVRNNFLKTEDDCTLLIPFSSFAQNCQTFFSVLSSILVKMKEAYGANLYSQDAAQKASNAKKQQQQEDRAAVNKENLIKILDMLLGNGIKSAIANMKCSVMILLKIMQAYSEVPQGDITKLTQHLNTLNQDYETVSSLIRNNLLGTFLVIKDLAEYEVEQAELQTLIDDIQIVCDAVALIKKYILAKVPLGETEIDDLMARCSLAAPKQEDTPVDTEEAETDDNSEDDVAVDNDDGTGEGEDDQGNENTDDSENEEENDSVDEPESQQEEANDNQVKPIQGSNQPKRRNTRASRAS